MAEWYSATEVETISQALDACARKDCAHCPYRGRGFRCARRLMEDSAKVLSAGGRRQEEEKEIKFIPRDADTLIFFSRCLMKPDDMQAQADLLSKQIRKRCIVLDNKFGEIIGISNPQKERDNNDLL